MLPAVTPEVAPFRIMATFPVLLGASARPPPTSHLCPPARSGTALRAPAGWLLHYSAALPGSTFVFSEGLLRSVGCKHESVLFLFNHHFKPSSVDLLFCPLISGTAVYSLSVIKIRTFRTQEPRLLLPVQGGCRAPGIPPAWKGAWLVLSGRGLFCHAPASPSAGPPAPPALCSRRGERAGGRGDFPSPCESVCSL